MLNNKNIEHCFLFLLVDMLSHVIFVHSVMFNFNKCKDPKNHGSYFPHPDSCSKFVQCSNAIAYEKDCAKTLVFSIDLHTCVFRLGDDDRCSNANVLRECDEIKKVTQKTDLQFPNPVACHRYFDCSNPTPHHRYSPFRRNEMECAFPLLWDINNKTCVDRKGANCGVGRQRPVSVCDYISSVCDGPNCRPCYLHNPSCAGRKDGLHSNPNIRWSRGFLNCKKSRKKSLPSIGELSYCPNETRTETAQFFDPEDLECVPLWKVPREYGGLTPNCDESMRPQGTYQLDVIDTLAYTCPEGDFFYCPIPYEKHGNISECQPMV